MAKFRSLFPSEIEVRQAESDGIKYGKSKKREFEIHRRLPLPDLVKIKLLEGEIGKIPNDYAEFLIKFNGARPNPSLVKLGDEIYILSGLLATAGDVKIYDSIENYCSVYKNRIPKNTCPIGYNPGGDLFLIDLNFASFGKIYYWMHDYESDDDKEPGYDNVIHMFDSFSELINNLSD